MYRAGGDSMVVPRPDRRIVGLVLLVFAGCGGASPAEDYCDALCDRARSCGQIVQSSCVPGCVDNGRDFFGDVRGEMVRGATPCIRDIECGVSDVSGSVAACLDAAQAELTPTESTVAFCEVSSPRYFDCGYGADVERCIEGVKWASEVLLERAIACTDDNCEGYESCVDEAFGRDN